MARSGAEPGFEHEGGETLFNIKDYISLYVKLSMIASMIKHRIMVHNYTKNDKSQQTVGT